MSTTEGTVALAPTAVRRLIITPQGL